MLHTTIQPADIHDLKLAINNLDLEPMVFKIMDPNEGESWPEAYARDVEIAYRQFLYLNALQPNFPVVPSKPIDEFWHYHILDTRKYEIDCLKIFGRMFHHFPYFGMRGEKDKAELNHAFIETKKLYLSEFGILATFFKLENYTFNSCGSNSCSGQSCSGNCQGEGERIYAAVCGGGDCHSCGGNKVMNDERPGNVFTPSSKWFERLVTAI
jgi:hypothetical protein